MKSKDVFSKAFEEKLLELSNGKINESQAKTIADIYTERILNDKSGWMAHKSMEWYIKDLLEDLPEDCSKLKDNI